ncbi:MAG: XRE family transcriptional regulator [Sphingobacteriales bacterium]|nr:MAG: XRE family transcriptional regulator [Sphingobacteriales bacterium]
MLSAHSSYSKNTIMKGFRQFKKAQGIGATRLRLGMTQEVFAMELGISRSLLSLAELGKRSLPTFALAKLAALEVSLAGLETIRGAEAAAAGIQPEDQFDNDHAAALLHYKEMQCRANADKKQWDLDIMIARYGQLRTSLDEAEQLLANVPGDMDNSYHCTMNILCFSLRRKISKCDIPAQNALRHKIALLHAEAGLHAVNRSCYGKDAA